MRLNTRLCVASTGYCKFSLQSLKRKPSLTSIIYSPMTPQMYARYVPAKEKLEVAKDLEASSILLSTQPDASDTYARYIPASKSKSQIHQATNVPSLLSKRKKASHDGEQPVKKKKTKKENYKYTFGRKSMEEAGTPKTNEKPYSSHVLVGLEASSTEKEALSPNLETPTPRNFTDGALKEVNMGLGDSDWQISMDGRPADPELKEAHAGIAKSGDKKHIKLMKKRDNYLKKVEAIAKAVPDIGSDTQEPVELYDLVPLPQSNSVPELPPISSAESLPPWLANPIRVSSTSTAQFEDLGLENDASTILQEKGFREAFAIQSAIIPILLNGVGDVVVSAATGSGKTLAYVLPMIRDLSKYQVSKLRGLIILPTRELVTQAKQVAELCATAFTSNKKVKIGTAVGNETLKVEQSTLIDHSYMYDPSAYQRAVEKSNFPWQDSEDMDGGIESIFEENSMCSLYDHVEDYKSKVDVLICTPGRLVEHLKTTLGFSLKNIRWLVVDEADKLLDQSFQQWLPTVMSAIDLRKDILPRSCVRKVILSATMTRDVGQLTQLKLYRPNFVLLESEITANKSEIHVLPPLLLESAIKVEEDGIKPLYLMELLKRESGLAGLSFDADTPDSDSVSESSSSEPDLDTDQNKDPDSDSDSTTKAESSQHLESPPQSFKSPKLPISSSSSRGVLIFTKSNESAVRLGRLIALLSPDLTSHIGLLTSTLPRASRQRTLQAFGKGNISLLVASDLVSRGLDLPDLAHVVNYDIPSSLTSYIHRIGRTARAGKSGHAWTLFTATEGRWFWNEIGRSPNVVRPSGKVERLNIKKEIFDQEKRRVYEGALEVLEKEATGHAARK